MASCRKSACAERSACGRCSSTKSRAIWACSWTYHNGCKKIVVIRYRPIRINVIETFTHPVHLSSGGHNLRCQRHRGRRLLCGRPQPAKLCGQLLGGRRTAQLGQRQQHLHGGQCRLRTAQVLAQLRHSSLEHGRTLACYQGEQLQQGQPFGDVASRQQQHERGRHVAGAADQLVGCDLVDLGEQPAQAVVGIGADRVENGLDVWTEKRCVLDGGQRQIAGQIAAQFGIAFLQEFHGDGQGDLHDRFLVVVLRGRDGGVCCMLMVYYLFVAVLTKKILEMISAEIFA